MKTARIVTAAARAKAAGPSSTATAPTRSTAAKRKTRADEQDEDGESDHNPARRPRGRPRKGTDQEDSQSGSETAARVTRTRVAKAAASDPANEPKTRGRPRKNTATEAARPAGEAPRRTTTRARAGTATRSTAAAMARSAPKKSVTFDETNKENIEPAGKKAAASKGLASRPARRAQTPTNHTTSGPKETEHAEKKPLSPKKVTQIPILRGREAADEEHGREQSPSSPVKKTPVKPSASSIPVARSADSEADEKDPDSTVAINAAILNAPESTTATFGSPPRRPPPSPSRDTMKSPAKRMANIPLPGSAMKHHSIAGSNSQDKGSQKSTMFQTPAKRPPSPIKAMAFPSSQKPQDAQDAFKASLFQSPAKRALPGLQPLSERQDTVAICETPAMKPLALSASVRTENRRPSEKLTFEDQDDGISELLADELLANTTQASRFSGRLSDVLPRHADPIADEEADGYEGSGGDEDDAVDLVQTASFYEEQPAEQEPVAEKEPSNDGEDMSQERSQEPEVQSTPMAQTTTQNPMFQLREKDMDPCHDMTIMSDSDDESDMQNNAISFTPGASKGRRSTMGLSTLADQLGSWSAASPIKVDSSPTATVAINGHITAAKPTPAVTPASEASPVKTSYFEEEMSAEQDTGAATPSADKPEQSLEALEDVVVTDEDLALAHEANEMSHMDMHAENAESARSFGDAASEASQEYGDENQMPIDPAILGAQPPVTPARPAPRNFSTTTKVPLKPADESSPSKKKRRFTAASIPSNASGSLPKSATVISYSPTKEKHRNSDAFDMADEPCTPGEKSDLWSSMGTPARTPRRDVNAQLLRGAVVFVDVHTSEGADASSIFVELLSHMGARCVKNWTWNPSGSAHSESSSSRIGITHVVFKDGGKRTMEKVRQSKGVVQCVGVSWVLE